MPVGVFYSPSQLSYGDLGAMEIVGVLDIPESSNISGPSLPRTIIVMVGVLPLRKNAVGVFYSPRWMGWERDGFMFLSRALAWCKTQMDLSRIWIQFTAQKKGKVMYFLQICKIAENEVLPTWSR